MAPNKIHITAIDMLLASITLTMQEDGARASFMYGAPGAQPWEKNRRADIFYHFIDLNIAALYVRSVGHGYLRALPISEIISKLQNFISENFSYIESSVFMRMDDRPLSAWVSDEDKKDLAVAISSSPLFSPVEQLNVFPLVPVLVENDFSSDQFFFSSPDSENAFIFKDEAYEREFDTKNFPPQIGYRGRTRQPASWLGVYSPDYRAALKARSSILGALALAVPPRHRHMFSGREVFGGRCTISKEGCTYSYEKEHTPPCMYDILITENDTQWMRLLSEKLRVNDRDVMRELKALEYFYRAWPLPPEERFPILCMSLDAIFGDANNATQAVVDGVNDTLGGAASEQQLRAIMKLRASVIHGGAPDVYDSSKYPKYYKKYGCDPIRDMEILVTACLRRKIFNDELLEHPDPNAELIKKAVADGRIPPKRDNTSILNSSFN